MNDATEIYILKKRIAYLESLLSAHNISFDAPDAPNSQSIIAPISVVCLRAVLRSCQTGVPTSFTVCCIMIPVPVLSSGKFWW